MLSVIEDHLLVKICPAIENTRSDGTLVAGIAKKSRAIKDKCGYLVV